ncbi:hypothetical protein JTB14_024208 [Gonioctena quinquepunctata]|nr:hypothetical protein JTB14_024208 [Gonioctena quinquepunctata]
MTFRDALHTYCYLFSSRSYFNRNNLPPALRTPASPTGIHPADREQVFKKLSPEQVADPTPIVENALTAFLKEQRFGDAVPSQRERTCLEVQPGCSISTAAYGQESDDDEDGELGIEDRPASVPSICDVGEEEANSEDSEVGQFILGTFYSQRGKKHINMFLCTKCSVFFITICQVFLISAEHGAPHPPEFEECVKSTGVKKDDFISKKVGPEFFCFQKCLMEKLEVLKDGDLYPDKLDDYAAFMTLIDFEKNKSELKKCLRGVGKIEECDDMKEIGECFHQFM